MPASESRRRIWWGRRAAGTRARGRDWGTLAPVLRSLRALTLFWLIFGSYGFEWLLARVLPKAMAARRLERAHRVNARRLLEGFSKLRGVFIKMGQVLSVMGT